LYFIAAISDLLTLLYETPTKLCRERRKLEACGALCAATTPPTRAASALEWG